MERIQEMNNKMQEHERKAKDMEERNKQGKYDRPILEMKAVLGIGTWGDDKGYYPKWSRDMANTLDKVGPGLGAMLEWLGTLKVGKEETLEDEWADECRNM